MSYYDAEFVSSINIKRKRSPKIILYPKDSYDYIDEQTKIKRKRKINLNMFHLIQNIDYLYKWYLNLDMAFEISDFPMDKRICVFELVLIVNDIEKLFSLFNNSKIIAEKLWINMETFEGNSTIKNVTEHLQNEILTSLIDHSK